MVVLSIGEQIATIIFFALVGIPSIIFYIGIIGIACKKAKSGDPEDLKRKIDFVKIKKHVLMAPEEKKIKNLVLYLVQAAENEAEIAYIFYYWLTKNIKYDYEALNNQGKMEVAACPNNVYQRRKGICEGISRLFWDMAGYANLKATYISGKTKDGSDDGHAWNAFKIDGYWYLTDVTWKQFLIGPEIFSYDHFPDESYWKLST